MEKLSISVILLTYNEESNIEECLKSLQGWVKEVFIVDSFSTDKTLEIARRYTDNIHQHGFENYAKQFNWAMKNLPVETEWILRLDADEAVTAELKEELLQSLPDLAADISGLYIKRRVIFMGQWIRHGGYYPIWLLRIWRRGCGYIEDLWMDEHIKISQGKTIFLKHDISEENKKRLDWWTGKHNHYATREAIDLLNHKYKFLPSEEIPAKLSGSQEQRKRWFKKNLYLSLPMFFRAFYYFILRYFFLLGFLDGTKGLIWHFLQGCWYRFLVDAKIYEIEKIAKEDNKSIKEVINHLYNKAL